MCYFEELKKFWKFGWRLFGVKFIYFMSGYKNEGVFLQNFLISYIFDFFEINFVVLDFNILRKFDFYKVKGEWKFGIFEDIIVVMKNNFFY